MHGVDLGVVPQNMIPSLKHERNTVAKRPAFTQEEYRQLTQFLLTWADKTRNSRIRRERDLLRNYVMIMLNSGMRVGEARGLKWRDLDTYRNANGQWVTLNVQGKTGKRLVVCQPGVEKYFDDIRTRKNHTGPDDYIFCNADGETIKNWTGFNAMLRAAGIEYDTDGNRHTLYSLRHTYATFRLQNGTNVYWLKKNMGTSVAMIERHYGQTNVLVGIEFETAKRDDKPPKEKAAKNTRRLVSPNTLRDDIKLVRNPDDLVPAGAVDMTPAHADKLP
jgi:integrase